MKRHAVLITGFFIIFALLSGCSSGGGIPVIPSIPEDTVPLITEPADRGTEEEMTTPFGGMLGAGGDLQTKVSPDASEGHYILYIYDITFDPVTNTVEVVPVRLAQKHREVSQYVMPPECYDCLTFQIINPDPPNYTVNVTLKNPTPLKAFDVRGIPFIGGPDDNRELLNADNYTTIHDQTFPPNKNPYKAFKVGDIKRAFNPDESDSVIFEMKFPSPPKFNLQFAIDISWPGNMKDPYDIVNQEVIGTLDTTGTAEATVRCDVMDWQNDIESVTVDLAPLGGGPVPMANEGGNTYSTVVTNTFGAMATTYTIEISAKSQSNPLVLFDYVDITVESGQNEPPKWVDVVGIDAVFPMDSACEISYGVAFDVDEPIRYLIFCSETTPIDFLSTFPVSDPDGSPHIYGGLENGEIYYFAVRAMDSLGMADDNENELPGTPGAPNQPPEWVDTEGITEAMPDAPGQVSVYYGEAIDPDEPVTYTVYYDDNLLDFKWEEAEKIEGNPGSPTLVTGLENDVMYTFGVRARDALGLEDLNIVLLWAQTVNLPPTWDEHPGGILEANAGDNEVEVVFGTATDPDSVGGDVVYNVYYSAEPFETEADFEANDPIEDQPGSPVIVGPLPNDILFYFVVRAEDEFGLEEKNMIQLMAIPMNRPPEWDGPVGVQNLVPGNEQISVEYSTASDPDIPVTYNVYYSDSELGFWMNAFVMEEQPGSPTLIEGLINDIPWYVAVRARDSFGLEEENTFILSATPSYDNTPPVWDDTVGVQEIIPGDMEVTVVYGTASDPDEPIIYNVYYSETSPIDFISAHKVPDFDGSPTVITPLINGQTNYFAVRAQDALGLEEENTVELPGAAVNEPPVWDDTVGIVDVQTNDEYALVYFGTASDKSPPVTYNVYWDTTSPIDFDTCDSSLDNATSPVYVSNLTNDQTYWFAVRARDVEGLEDDNTVELSATPEEQPPVWDGPIGIQQAVPDDEQVTVIYGSASDPDVPVTYNVYYSQTTPIDFDTAPKLEVQPGSPTVVGSLPNDIEHYFAVKARDATGMEDDNTVELAATPHYYNQPPEWDGLPGILDAQPGDQQVTVTYGTASDPDLPVTYNVYWDTVSPINFVTADKKIGELGSPTVVDGLINDQQYFFAVRAMDGLGMEDTNINELPATPTSGNEPPVWDTTVGITGATPLSEAIEVEYGTASDPDLPVTYRIYYEENAPVDWDTSSYITDDESPTTLDELTNASFYGLGVRTVDGYGLEDGNTIQISRSPNLPPEWPGGVGIIEAEPMYAKAVISFYEAEDVDGVTYNIYYTKTSPINFPLIIPITGVTSSPYTVEGLDNGDVYYFAVRAVDDLGMEDDNIIEASAEIWDAPDTKWLHPTGSAILSSPNWLDVNADGWEDVIIGGQDGLMKALNAIDGNVEWSRPAVGAIDSSPCLVDINGGVLDVVYGSFEGSVYAVDGDYGGLFWSFPTGGQVSSSPASGDVDDDGDADIVIGSYDYNVYVIDATTGVEVWHQPTGGTISSSPALYDATGDGKLEVYIGSSDGRMYCFNGDGSGYDWYYPTSQPITTGPVIGDVEGDGDKECVFVSGDGYLYALDALTGAFRWNVPLGGGTLASPVLGDVNEDGAADIAIGKTDGTMYLIDGATHSVIWTVPGAGAYGTPAVLVDMTGEGILDVLVGSEDGNLYCFDGTDGSVVFTISVMEPITCGPMVFDIDDDNFLEIVFATASGIVFAIDTGRPNPGTSDIIWPKFHRTINNRGVL